MTSACVILRHGAMSFACIILPFFLYGIRGKRVLLFGEPMPYTNKRDDGALLGPYDIEDMNPCNLVIMGSGLELVLRSLVV